MEETPPKETPAPGLNKIDLSQLQDFQFGTQWTEVKSTPAPHRERERDRESRRDGLERTGGGEARRDRRSFRRPVGVNADAPSVPGGHPGTRRDERDRSAGEYPRREGYRDGRPPRREGPGDRRGPGGAPRFLREQRPYQSPFFNVVFYPEDAGFMALVKAMRASCRTFELFEIARLILGKFDRFVVVVSRRTPDSPPPVRDDPGPSAAPPVETADSNRPIFVSLPDGMPHETEEAAVAHVMSRYLDRFFELADVEVEPPKGSFPFVNRCTLSGELLGPPNYHRYAQIVQQHHAARFPRMSMERFREHIETVRDPEVVAQWVEKMKRTTRYTWKPAAEGEQPVSFDNFEDARAHLLTAARPRMVKAVESCRFHAKLIETLPPGELHRAIEGQLERQRRFPLDTANALRGRLRREGFTIFKKGAKGVSYVCAVKRRFRIPGQSFAEGINALIGFLEANPMILVKDLPVKLLGISPPPAFSPPPSPAPSMSVSPIPTEAAAPSGETPAEPPPPAVEPPAPPVEAAPATPPLSEAEQEKLRRMTIDLRWLVREGYVTEFADGRLFAPPPIAEARARAQEDSETEDHDLESFPEPAAADEPPAVPPAPDAEPPAGGEPAAATATPAPTPSDESVTTDPSEPQAATPPESAGSAPASPDEETSAPS